MKKKLIASLFAAPLCLVCVSGNSAGKDCGLNEMYRARPIAFPSHDNVKTFKPAENRADFTDFRGLRDVKIENGKLVFTLAAKRAVLGWGNYMGRQAALKVKSLWAESDKVELKLRQSGKSSAWTMYYWSNGKRMNTRKGKAKSHATMKGSSEQTLKFTPPDTLFPVPDGLEFEIKGTPGDKIEISGLKVIQNAYSGYCRNEFELPEGKIWKAVFNVGGPCPWFSGAGIRAIHTNLYINGKKVRRRGAPHIYHVSGVDVASFLRPGKNCVGIYGERFEQPPFIYLQGAVIMESGKVINIDTGPNWRFSESAGKEWCLPGYDARDWRQVSTRRIRNFKSMLLLRGKDGRLAIPAYEGMIKLKNPLKKDLFYLNTNKTPLEILIPEGLKAGNPEIEYVFGRARMDGTTEKLRAGVLKEFTRSGDSLLYKIDFGKLNAGVYTVALQLKDKGKVIAKRPREPLAVIRKPDSRIIIGKNYFEGLDTELEDSIDFTDPNDPHPWIEAARPDNRKKPYLKIDKPKIVEKDGLKYREITGKYHTSYFSYQLQFKHPGDFYVIELEYPDNAERSFTVSISSKKPGIWSNSQTGSGVDAGRKYNNTGKMRKLRFIHVADSGPHSVDIINMAEGISGAAKSLKIYHVKGGLPKLDAGKGRKFGIHSERCYYSSGIGRNFGVDHHKFRTFRADAGVPLRQQMVRKLVWTLDTCGRYARYLDFTGQNTFVMGCYQYIEANTPMAVPDETGSSSIQDCMRSVLANVLEANGIDFYAGLELNMFQYLMPPFNDAQIAQGHSTVFMVDGKGRQQMQYLKAVQNWLHPKVRALIMDLMNQYDTEFGDFSHFKGVHSLFGPVIGRDGYWLPGFALGSNYSDPFKCSYDDLTFKEFSHDTGIEFPVDVKDPKRFEKRRKLATSPKYKEQFVNWRCVKFAGLLEQMVKALRSGKRKDLDLVGIVCIENEGFIKFWLKSGFSYDQLLKMYGLDLKLLGNLDGVWMGRWTLGWRRSLKKDKNATQMPYSWVFRTDKRIISPYNSCKKRCVFVRSSWDENFKISPGKTFTRRGKSKLVKGTDWVIDAERTRTTPQNAIYHSREALIEAIISADPELIVGGFTDLNINVGCEQYIRELTKVFTKLPPDRFKTVLDTGFESNFAIRQLNRKSDAYFYVANPGYWHINGTVTIKTPGRVYNLDTGKLISPARKGGQLVVPVRLKPYGLAAFKIDSPKLEIVSFATSAISPDELKHMTGILDRIGKLIGNSNVQRACSSEDRIYVNEILNRAKQALGSKHYAKAWQLLKSYRLWCIWKEQLEKAAENMAFLPDSVKKVPNRPPCILNAAPLTGKIVIDGEPDEPAWKRVPFSAGFYLPGRKPAVPETGVKALYDGKNLYLAFICADSETEKLKAVAADPKGVLHCKDDAIGIVLQPAPDVHQYCQLAFNPEGVKFSQLVTGHSRNYNYKPGWKAAAKKRSKYWTGEAVIPYKAFDLAGHGKNIWKANFFRVFRNNQAATSFWSPASQVHDTSSFGTIKFK